MMVMSSLRLAGSLEGLGQVNQPLVRPSLLLPSDITLRSLIRLVGIRKPQPRKHRTLQRLHGLGFSLYDMIVPNKCSVP